MPENSPVRTVQVELGARSYPILIGEHLHRRAELIVPYLKDGRAAVVTNSTVANLYLEQFADMLKTSGIEVVPIVVPDGEEHKNWQTLNHIFDVLLQHRCERDTTLIALGGGVVGDLAGFAAATYLRGVALIHAPTTLLAQVDSAVGGKTAINHPLGKNMIGAFHQPRLVLSDIATLSTLPDRELSAGLAEVIKYGLIMDREFLDWLDRNIEQLVARDSAALRYAVQRSCENKARIVAADEREGGQRALLNLGHTFGHAIETGLGYGRWLHGEAVAAGTMLAARLSQRMGHLTETEVRRIESLLRRARLPVDAPALGPSRYMDLMGHDKKVAKGRIRLVLLRSLGEAFVTDDYPAGALRDVLATASTDV
ncbi:MAG TPA: 3-dehydroquinate synthase [Burkholderiales bacterium]|jgi:3-dehydroquinate synthase|nr:3-dehydroquinate synthase [Burkholderiales bacterium]